MQKHKLWIGLIIVGIAALLFTAFVNAQDATTKVLPGSTDDPIVTKSYVDEQVALIVAREVDKIRKELLNQPPISSQPPTTPETPLLNPNELVVVTVKQGEQLIAGAGTEFIVRSGRAILFSSDNNGVPNITAGRDIPKGAVVPNNHLILFPREGRGIQPDSKSKTELVVMVRGFYQIKQNL